MADVEERDLGWDAIKRELQKADRGEVTVGIHADEKAADGQLTTAQVGAFHEFGVGVPQRAFLGPTIDEKADDLFDLGERLYWRRIFEGKATARQGLATLGTVAQDAIKAKIRDSDPAWPPLAMSTKRQKARTIRGRKGESHSERKAAFVGGDGNPLVDTGQLLNSIRYRVGLGAPGDA